MQPNSPAWRAATEAAKRSGVRLSELRDMADAVRVTRVVGEVWGEDVLDPALVRALLHAGNVLYGAHADDDALVGFVLGFLGWDEALHLHSHMLGVLPDWRSRGVGYALKLAQRAAALDHDVPEVRWTFDPLVGRNGRFNLVKLGAVAVRLFPHFYGDMRDELNAGDRTDRFEVRWALASDRVERALADGVPEPPRGPVLLEPSGHPGAPEPRWSHAAPEPGARVRIPRDHLSVRRRDAALGRRWREASAAAFQACFDAGLVAGWASREGEYAFGLPEVSP